MRKIVEAINNDHPILAAALPCYMQDDHLATSTFVRRCESQSAMGEVEVTARAGTIGMFENFPLTCGS